MIQLEKVSKSFDNGLVKALDEVSLTVKEGSIISLMGPSGCGKTTLLNIIGTLESPEQGRVMIQNQSLDSYRPFHYYRTCMVGFVFQFHHLIPCLTLLENVELPMYSKKISKNERRKRACELLQTVDLGHRINFIPAKVSGGERQRTAIARSLVNNPRIILADEPTGSIDSENGRIIMDYMIKLCQKHKTTFLMATHNKEIAARSDRIIFMKDGRLE